MNSPRHNQVTLNPNELGQTMHELTHAFGLIPEEANMLVRIVALFPRPALMYVDTQHVELYADIPLADKFTFDMDTDELILFAQDMDTIIDGLIEMAMYLTGFSTKMGNSELWIVDFTIGAWKPVKHRIKRQLGIPVPEQPRGLVGVRPQADDIPDGDPYPFRTLVSHFDQLSFQQMIMLAARDDVTVYFPPGTHPKVRAVYMHARRAIEEVGRYITLQDHQIFNLKLNNAIRRIEQLFEPQKLEPPNWIARIIEQESDELAPLESPSHTSDYNPFEAFIEELFSDEDDNELF